MDSKLLAKNIRKDCIVMTASSGAGHIASILSIVDILSVLYTKVLRVSPNTTKDPNRDKFILSKGHAGCAVYACLGELGFFDRAKLGEYYSKTGTTLSGHVTNFGNNGVEFSTGALGHGICVAGGIALADKMDKRQSKVYTIVGNGECNEGSVWEAMMFASHHKLDNFVVIVDDNQMQAWGDSKQIMDMGNLEAKFEAFGACVVTIDGHNHDEIYKACKTPHKGQPLVIIAKTIKGKGLKFLESDPKNHGVSLKPEMIENALKEVDAL